MKSVGEVSGNDNEMAILYEPLEAGTQLFLASTQYTQYGYVREIRPGEFKFSKTCSWGPEVWAPVFIPATTKAGATETDLTKSSIFALLQQGMKDRHAYGIATLISLCPELFNAFEQYANDKLESEAELEAQEPAGFVKFKEHVLVFMPFKRVEDGTQLYTTSQPPAPCQKCVESEKTLQAIAEHVDWAFIGDLDDVVASRINERNDAIAHFATERDALQAKVAEITAKLEESSGMKFILACESYRETIAQQAERIAELEIELKQKEKAGR